MYHLGHGVFSKDGEELKTISNNIELSEEWQQKQLNSIDEYEQTHLGEYPDYIKYIFRLYGWALNKVVLDALTGENTVNVLDVGCGISTHTPPYFDISNNRVNYIGLDPYTKNLNRNYMFINSVLEDVDSLIPKNSIDVFCFSTSLDHIEDLDLAFKKMKAVAKPNAKVVILQSVRDSDIYATKYMYYHLKQMNQIGFTGFMNRLKFLNRLRIFNSNILKSRKQVQQLEYKMKNNIALDEFHFHYFTRNSLTDLVNENLGKTLVNQLIEPYQVVITVNEIN